MSDEDMVTGLEYAENYRLDVGEVRAAIDAAPIRPCGCRCDASGPDRPAYRWADLVSAVRRYRFP